MNEEKKTSKGWRVGDRVAWCERGGFGAVILDIGIDDECFLRFDDDSEGWHNLNHLPWRRLRSKKITFKKEKK